MTTVGVEGLTFPNVSCPRFVTIDFTEAGFGDQLTRLLYLYTVAQRWDLTAVVDKHYGMPSTHSKIGYKLLYEKLGFPAFPLNETGLHVLYPNLNKKEFSLDDLLLNDGLVFHCQSLAKTNISSCHGGWCPQSLSHFVEILSRPMVDVLSRSRSEEFKIRLHPLRDDLVNIVWHVRTGDICLRCDDRKFFRNIYEFLKKSVDNFNFQNIIVHLPDKRVSRLFSNKPNTIYWTESDEETTFKLFFNADILVATGSSFPIMAGWLTPLNRPIMFISERKEHFWLKSESIQGSLYDLSEGRAIRLSSKGDVLNYNHEHVKNLLRGAISSRLVNVSSDSQKANLQTSTLYTFEALACIFTVSVSISFMLLKFIRKNSSQS